MIYPDMSVNEWCSLHGLEVRELECSNCKKTVSRNVPFAMKGYRGLIVKDHGCGIEFGSSISVPVGEKLDNWNELLRTVKDGEEIE